MTLDRQLARDEDRRLLAEYESCHTEKLYRRTIVLDCLSQEPSEVPMNPVTVKMSTSNPPEPMLEQAIRHRAHELYFRRGMAHGHDVDDWLQAEAELVHGHSTSDSN